MLRQFIREELTWNYWLRRPREDRNLKSLVQPDPGYDRESLIRALQYAGSEKKILDALVKHNVDASDVLSDPLQFSRYLRDGDIAAARNLLLKSLGSGIDIARTTGSTRLSLSKSMGY